MKKKGSAVQQMIAVLKEPEAGMPAAELIRWIGIATMTIWFRWLRRFLGTGCGLMKSKFDHC